MSTPYSPFYTGDPYPVSPIIQSIVELFSDPTKICRHSIAQDKNKQPCMPNATDAKGNPVATSWSLVGALYKFSDDSQLIYNILWNFRYYLNGNSPNDWFANKENSAEDICYTLADFAEWADFWNTPDVRTKLFYEKSDRS